MSIICVLQDVKADFYHKPVIFPSRGEALRSIMELVNDTDSKHPVTTSPQDFIFWQIADIDDMLAVVCPVNHLSLGKCSDFVKKSD